MVTHFDHVTVVVRDVEKAKEFFGLLGFQEDKSVVITGKTFSRYMGVEGIKAEHVTLVLRDASPRTEVQLLKYRHPDPTPDPHITDLANQFNQLALFEVIFHLLFCLRHHPLNQASSMLFTGLVCQVMQIFCCLPMLPTQAKSRDLYLADLLPNSGSTMSAL